MYITLQEIHKYNSENKIDSKEFIFHEGIISHLPQCSFFEVFNKEDLDDLKSLMIHYRTNGLKANAEKFKTIFLHDLKIKRKL